MTQSRTPFEITPSGPVNQPSRRQFLSMTASAAFVASALPLLEACGGSSPTPAATTSTQSFTIKAATGGPLDNINSRLTMEFKKRIEASTKGRITIQAFPYSDLGTVQGVFDQMHDGVIQMYSTGPSYPAKYLKDIQILTLPFLFPDRDTFYKAVDGAIGQDIAAKSLKPTACRLLGFGDFGFYSFATKKAPITKLEDLKGLKIHVQPSPVFTDSMKLWGGAPVSVNTTEIFTALQAGTIEAVEFPISSVLSFKFYQAGIKYVTLGREYLLPETVWMNDAFWKTLPSDLQKQITTDFRAAQLATRPQRVADDDTARAGLVSNGVVVSDLPASELPRFRKAVQPLYDAAGTNYGPDGGKWVQQALALK